MLSHEADHICDELYGGCEHPLRSTLWQHIHKRKRERHPGSVNQLKTIARLRKGQTASETEWPIYIYDNESTGKMVADCPKVGRLYPCPWASQGFCGVGDDDRKQAEEGEAKPRPHVLVGSLHDTTDRWKRNSVIGKEWMKRRVFAGYVMADCYFGFWLGRHFSWALGIDYERVREHDKSITSYYPFKCQSSHSVDPV